MNLRREDLLLSVRAVLGRPAESLLLALGMALAVGVTAAGLALAGRTAAQSREQLASPRYREIVVATRQQAGAMELPARVRADTEVVLTVDDLEARTVAPAIRYAYLSNPTGFPLGELAISGKVAAMAAAVAAGGTTGAGAAPVSVEVIVIPAGGQSGGPPGAGDAGPVSGSVTAGQTAGGGYGSGAADAKLQFSKEVDGFGQPLLTAPEGPQPQLELVTGFEVSPEFFAAWNLTPAAGSLFTAADMARGEPILVLGAQLGATLFADGKPLDRQVLSLNRLYRITGVLTPSGTEMDRHAFAPAPLAADRFKAPGIRLPAGNTSLRFAVADASRLAEARAQLTSHFAAAYGAGAVVIDTPRAEAAATADRYRRLVTVTLFLELAALVIAAVNMTNIFFSRALRRRRAVGILKALGASIPKVFAVFFLEALVVGAAGAAMGLGLALLLSRLMEQTVGFGVRHGGLTMLGVAAAWLLVATCTVLPAAAAARVPAADAIRYE